MEVAQPEDLDKVVANWWDIFPTTYPAQRRAVTGSNRPVQMFIGGRATGKSWVSQLKALWLSIRNPGQLRPDGSILPCPGAICGRTMKEVEDKLEPYLLEHVRSFQERTGVNLIRSYSAKHQRYTLINGAWIYKLSYGRADSLKKLRGYTLAWMVFDEIEHAEVDSAAVFDIAGFCLRHPLAEEPCFAAYTSPAGLRGLTARVARLRRANDPTVHVTTATVYDNPHVDDAFRERMKRGCSPSMWAQEGLGHILRPAEVVYKEYDEKKHVIPWTWNMSLPWVLGIDWGERDGHMVAIQVDPTNGRWVVAREALMVDGSRPRQRDMIRQMMADIGYPPYMIGADRAITSENNWLYGSFGSQCRGGIETFKNSEHQLRSWGIGAVQFMLDPGDRDEPRLFFSSSLAATLDAHEVPLRTAVQQYRWLKQRLDTGEVIVTNRAEENTPNTHPCDSLRYIIGVSVWDTYLHGGEALPYAIANDAVDYPDEQQGALAWHDQRA